MPAKLEKTRTPGIFKRGNRYAVVYRDPDGRQRQRTARTYDEARALRSKLTAAVAEGSYQPATRLTLAEYAREWVEQYQGNRRGFTDETRAEYRRDFERYVLPVLGRLRLEQITAPHVRQLVTWLCDDDAQRERHATECRQRAEQRERLRAAGRADEARKVRDPRTPGPTLADATVARILSPLRACLATAVHDGVIRSNPTANVRLPKRDEARRIEAGEDLDHRDVRALTTEQLAALLDAAPPRHALLFRLIAATGVRIGEAAALRWADLSLRPDVPSEPQAVHVRRAWTWTGRRFKTPKSEQRRRVPLDPALAAELLGAWGAALEARLPDYATAEHMEQAAADLRGALVFPSDAATVLGYSNLMDRAFKPAAEQAGVPWAGFHTLRHTFASRMFAAGRNAKQVSKLLGHHKPSFTLDTYVHLMDDDLGDPLALPVRAPGVSAGVSATVGTAPHALATEARIAA